MQTCREDFLDLKQPRRPEKSRQCDQSQQGGACNISFMDHKSQDNWCKTPTWNWWSCISQMAVFAVHEHLQRQRLHDSVVFIVKVRDKSLQILITISKSMNTQTNWYFCGFMLKFAKTNVYWLWPSLTKMEQDDHKNFLVSCKVLLNCKSVRYIRYNRCRI